MLFLAFFCIQEARLLHLRLGYSFRRCFQAPRAFSYLAFNMTESDPDTVEFITEAQLENCLLAQATNASSLLQEARPSAFGLQSF